MVKEIKTLDGALFSPWQLLSAANAYYALSCVLADQFPKGQGGTNTGLPSGSAIAASATNRILALELYLKAFLVGNDLAVPCHHNLVLLYDALPQKAREIIRIHFDENNDLNHVQGDLIELFYCFQLGPSLSEQSSRKILKSLPEDISLIGLLDRNRKGFVSSRYLFEQARRDRPQYFLYEYWRLGILCGVLCAMLEAALPNPPQHYIRTFNF